MNKYWNRNTDEMLCSDATRRIPVSYYITLGFMLCSQHIRAEMYTNISLYQIGFYAMFSRHMHDMRRISVSTRIHKTCIISW